MSVNDYSAARTGMVDCQIRPSDVTDPAVIRAFSTVPREEFVPTRQRELAYIDDDILIEPATDTDPARYLMAPRVLAKMMHLAQVGSEDIVLDIGCGSGYSSAILCLLCNSVVAVEENVSLADRASASLTELSFDNVTVVTGPLTKGYPAEGPYDVIFVAGSVDFLPDELSVQLKTGGRLVVVEGQGNAAVARLYSNNEGIFSGVSMFNCSVKPLPGFAKTPEFVF